MEKSLRIRIISSVILVLIVVVAFWIGGRTKQIFMLLAAGLCVFEMRQSLRLNSIQGHILAALALIVLFFSNYISPLAVIFFYTFIKILYLIVTKNENIYLVSNSLFAFVYGGIPLYMLYSLSLLFTPRYLYIWVLLIATATDVCAYLVGTFFGRRKLLPSISPSKTVEGALGGIAGALVVSILFRIFFMKDVTYFQVIWISLAGSVLAELGDIAASYLKRQMGIKDFGRIIPGHGGLMDRLDSISVVTAFFFIVLGVFFS